MIALQRAMLAWAGIMTRHVTGRERPGPSGSVRYPSADVVEPGPDRVQHLSSLRSQQMLASWKTLPIHHLTFRPNYLDIARWSEQRSSHRVTTGNYLSRRSWLWHFVRSHECLSQLSFIARLIWQVFWEPAKAAEVDRCFVSTSAIFDLDALRPQPLSLSVRCSTTITSRTYAAFSIDDPLPWNVLTVIFKLVWFVLVIFWKMLQTYTCVY